MADRDAPSLAHKLRVRLFGLAGLVLTPVVTFLIGWAIYGRRASWNADQGDSWLVFLMAVYATPFGALYWALVAAIDKTFPRGGAVRRLLPVAVYVAGLALAVVVAVQRYS